MSQDRAIGTLLQEGDPDPTEILYREAQSDFFLICEHAGRMIPGALGDMGLGEDDRRRHIAWDIGARQLAVALSQRLGCPLYMQRYSRLVCDCNRRPDVPSFTPERSEDTIVPANVDLTAAQRQKRADEIFWPFHNAVSQALGRRKSAGRKTNLVTIHTFTPVFQGRTRPWEIGVLFNRDRRFAPAIAEWLKANSDHIIGINEPYAVSDESDYAIPVHGENNGLPCVEFEIRNDLLSSDGSVAYWSELLERALRETRLSSIRS
ncbi:N-formylglutamate amidohydrolase [Pararhizobium haloflavum]|uniref:N-formylglutamate amidohydrolase n=1 Tax=Pararhizobium haloflavum TaxID=2037914 RepID=UPI00130014CC|nr:N-formylglutamate amidohydrolase [Pararhizobium haloflavum]